MALGLTKSMNQITFQATNQTSTGADFQIGQQGQTPNGNIYVYVQAAVAVANGAAVIPTAAVSVSNVSSSTNNLNQIVYITKASAGWTNGQFAGDYVTVDTGTGVGQFARIMDNTADTLYLYGAGLGTALSVSDSGIKITKLWHVSPAAITSKKQNCQGIAQVAFAAGEFGWVLQKGVGQVAAGVALTPIGSDFTTGDSTVGQVILGVATDGQFDAQSLGRVLVVNGVNQLATVQVDVL